MMRLWLSRNASESIREQLVIQIRLGILSGDLAPGSRLPSVRELGRRYELHANTVSAAYGELERQGLLRSRKGSGVYVADVQAPKTPLTPSHALDAMVREFLDTARERGFTAERVRLAVDLHARRAAAKRIVVVEPEPELCNILVEELRAGSLLSVTGLVLRGAISTKDMKDALVTALLSRSQNVHDALPFGTPCHFLRLRSTAEHFATAQRPAANALIGIASSSPEILRRTRTVLTAVGLDADALEFRDARESGWSRGLATCAFVIADVITAKRLPKGCTVRELRLLSEESMAELRGAVSVADAGGATG